MCLYYGSFDGFCINKMYNDSIGLFYSLFPINESYNWEESRSIGPFLNSFLPLLSTDRYSNLEIYIIMYYCIKTQ